LPREGKRTNALGEGGEEGDFIDRVLYGAGPYPAISFLLIHPSTADTAERAAIRIVAWKGREFLFNFPSRASILSVR